MTKMIFKKTNPPPHNFFFFFKLKPTRLKKTLVISILLFAILLPNGIAAEGFDANNIYIELDGQFAPPVVFSGNEKLTDIGFGGGVEIGIDIGGWLFGARYTFLMYLENPNDDYLMENFMHNIAGLCVSKTFTKSQWRFLPMWLDIRLKLAAAWDFASSDYYVSSDAKKAGAKTNKKASGFLYSAGIFTEFGKDPYVVPFLGANFDFTHDKGGMYFMPTVAIGLRTKIGAFNTKKNEKTTKIGEDL